MADEMALTVDHDIVKAQVHINTGSSTYNEFVSHGSSKSPRTRHIVSDEAIIRIQLVTIIETETRTVEFE